ncbi:MAG: peptidylprolyl isomerase [Lachnospiraceae bacterium]|nr:peptidylprolyl isomerase [Lachnospiraceae bacterium]
MKKCLTVVLTAFMLAGCLAACGSSAKETAENTAAEKSAENAAAEENTEAAAQEDEAAKEPLRHIEIEIADYGTVKLELDPNEAPLTVANFVKLAQDGFYDGLTFHRIMDGFMIQGGDPLGNGSGGSSEHIKGEFAANGVDNSISHKKGVISMARAADPDSASSQFFIMVADGDFLDGNYAAFGWVTEGQEIVDQIAKDAKPIDNNGTVPKEEQPVITSIKVID